MSERTYKLMVADDDDSVRESLCKLLRGEGYQVVAVADGAETVETFAREQNQIDLLLVDLNMPLKNGWATLDRLLEINPCLPVLIVTGQPNQYEMAQAAGASGLIEKPIDVTALLSVIHDLLVGPAKSRAQNRHHPGLQIHVVRAAGYTLSQSWKAQHDVSYHHGGLNE